MQDFVHQPYDTRHVLGRHSPAAARSCALKAAETLKLWVFGFRPAEGDL